MKEVFIFVLLLNYCIIKKGYCFASSINLDIYVQ